MRIPTDSESEEPVINLTPLLDVVFNLIIFFMVTTTFHRIEQELSVEVPRAEHGEAAQEIPDVLTVNITREGEYRVLGRVLSAEELGALLVEARRRNREQAVVIRADRRGLNEHTIRVFDLCAGAGISDTSWGVEDGR